MRINNMKFFNRKNISKGSVTLALIFSASTVYSADFPETGNFSDGSKAWAENCNRCHNMRDAEELRDDQWISTTFHMRVRAGLTGQETRDVITFLQASNTKPMASGSIGMVTIVSSGATGKEIYEQTCISCHGTDGAGVFPGVPDFTSSDGALSKTDEVLLKNVTNGFQSPGSPMAMPPKGGNPNLNAADISAVLKYVHQMFGK